MFTCRTGIFGARSHGFPIKLDNSDDLAHYLGQYKNKHLNESIRDMSYIRLFGQDVQSKTVSDKIQINTINVNWSLPTFLFALGEDGDKKYWSKLHWCDGRCYVVMFARAVWVTVSSLVFFEVQEELIAGSTNTMSSCNQCSLPGEPPEHVTSKSNSDLLHGSVSTSSTLISVGEWVLALTDQLPLPISEISIGEQWLEKRQKWSDLWWGISPWSPTEHVDKSNFCPLQSQDRHKHIFTKNLCCCILFLFNSQYWV